MQITIKKWDKQHFIVCVDIGTIHNSVMINTDLLPELVEKLQVYNENEKKAV